MTTSSGTSSGPGQPGAHPAQAGTVKYGAMRSGVICSFCLRPVTEVTTMVGGPGVFICDVCVSACAGLIEGQAAGTPALRDWEDNLTDDGLLALLPQAAGAGAQVDRYLADWVRRARTRGITWARIGAALGTTRQSAWERFSGEE